MKLWKVYEDYTDSMYIVKAETETQAISMVADTIRDKWAEYAHEEDVLEDEVCFDAREVLCNNDIDLLCSFRGML